MAHGKASRPGSRNQPSVPSTGPFIPGPVSLPPGYYEYYGLRAPESPAPASGAVQARRAPPPHGWPPPPGVLEYYGITPSLPTEASRPALSLNDERSVLAADGGTEQARSAAAPVVTPPGAVAVQALSGDRASGHEAESIQAAAGQGVSGASGSLPYLDEIQRSFGRHDLSDVKAHTDSQAAAGARALGALAFTTGEHVAFAGAPDLHTAAHEAAHVVQQRGGVQLRGGMGAAGDRYEQHAEAVAERVVRGESAAALLDEYAPGPGAARQPAQDGGAATQRRAVQLRESEAEEGGTEASAAPTGRAAPTDVFLQVVAATRLHRASGAVLTPTPVALRVGDVVREALPGDAEPRQVRGHRFVTTAAELFGWVPSESVAEIARGLAPVEGAESLDEQAPSGEMPTIGVDEYDHLLILRADTLVYPEPVVSDTMDPQQPIVTAQRMETVVFQGDPISRKGGRWQRVRLLRQPPIVGWIQGAQGTVADTTNGGAGGLGDPPLGLGEGMVAEGPAVMQLELRLHDLHYDPGTIDGVFTAQEDGGGPSTEGAVRAFQADQGITADGWVGPQTGMALARARRGDTPVAAETGTWVNGYRLINGTTGRTMTPDGQPSSAGFTSWPQGGGSWMPAGPCEVLHQGGAEATAEVEGEMWWYVRGPSGGAGWTRVANVARANASGTAGPSEAGEGRTEIGLAEELAQLCPNGVTVCFVTQFTGGERQFGTFVSEGAAFAAEHLAVAVSGGQLVTGTVNLITHKDQVVSILARIQETLRAGAAEVPAWARVAHLAFFTHGSQANDRNWGGLQTDADNWEESGNLRLGDLQGFARTLSAFCTSDVEVSLFACSTGREWNEEQDWRMREDLTGGEGSFADEMADQLANAGASDARVMGHTTIGPTVRNPFARLYMGGEEGGVNVFNWVILPLGEWLGEELELLRGTRADAETFLTDELFNWFNAEVIDPAHMLLASRMSSDPELFKVEMRQRALAWVRSQRLEWGVITGDVRLRLRLSYDINPTYRSGDWPPVVVKIPGHAELQLEGPAEDIAGTLCYPVTWEGDPGEHQAWLAMKWVEVVAPEGTSSP